MKKKELTVLSSNVILPNKTTINFDDLSESCKNKVQLELCQHISQQLSTYYSLHIKEWDNFKINNECPTMPVSCSYIK